MRNTAIFVNKIELKKNDGEISHTTSQHATLDRHDRSIPRDVPRDKGLYPVNIFIPWDNFWFIPLQPYNWKDGQSKQMKNHKNTVATQTRDTSKRKQKWGATTEPRKRKSHTDAEYSCKGRVAKKKKKKKKHQDRAGKTRKDIDEKRGAKKKQKTNKQTNKKKNQQTPKRSLHSRRNEVCIFSAPTLAFVASFSFFGVYVDFEG